LRGRDVIFGLVDVSFEPFDPLLRDAVVATWDQTAVTGGAEHPSGVGRVFTSPGEWGRRSPRASSRWSEHGTEVAAIGAGRNPAGFAPEAEIVAVVVKAFERVPHAVSWIFDIATKMGLPAVANLSLRRDHCEPHDGSDVVSQELDRLAGPGRLIVAAAGNEGGLHLHVRERLDMGSTTRVPLGAAGMVGHSTRLCAYSADGSPYRIRLVAKAGEGDAPVTTEWIEPGEEEVIDDGVWFVFIANGAADRADAGAIEVMRIAGDDAQAQWWIELQPLTRPTTVDLWSADNFGEFCEEVAAGVWVEPPSADRSFLVASPAVARSVLAVGASCRGELADFSNNGPSVDGRLKPEVVLPGCELTIGKQSGLEGTSYAAPMLAGILACALEVDPTLDPTGARSLLQAACVPEGREGWGYGTLDTRRLQSALFEGDR
jgi:hypothetical protein